MFLSTCDLRITFVVFALVAFGSTRPVSAGLLIYQYSGIITEVSENENNVIPDLAIGDTFTGFTTFESTGWNGTSGTVFAVLNGVDLLFTGDYIYGDVAVEPSVSYSIRVGGDAGGSIDGSTFSAGYFGPDLMDTDGSAGYSEPFPPSFDLDEFEVNVFRIWGIVIGSGDRLFTTGRLTEFYSIPEPTSGWLGVFAVSCLVGCRRKRKRAGCHYWASQQ